MSNEKVDKGTTSAEAPSPAVSDAERRKKRLEEMEAKAVDKAKATADAAFRPPPSILNASTAEALLHQVDGPSLETYEGKESVYVGRSVPVSAGAKLTVPLQVTTPGSVLEYVVEIKNYDINFKITAEREEGITVVREMARLDTADGPLSQKFLVGSVPCLIEFTFDNEFSWMREKITSYKITITPPSRESLAQGRRRRAEACLKAVQEDLQKASTRLDDSTTQRTALEQAIEKLQQQLTEKMSALEVAQKEESWLKERKTLRLEQQKLLQQRLENGWDDEKALNGVVTKAKK